jgi:isoquinoline 1-oxidoreductase subunit alpha
MAQARTRRNAGAIVDAPSCPRRWSRHLFAQTRGSIIHSTAIAGDPATEDRTLFILTVNGQAHQVDVEPDTPLLWVLRDTIGLTGTKFGCGIAACGACTVHVDGAATRSCQLAVEDAVGSQITTIEGLSADGMSHPVQRAWLELDVPQCGYCQSGQIMAAAALLAETPKPSDDDIAAAMTNLCRCGTYQRIRAGVRRAIELQSA